MPLIAKTIKFLQILPPKKVLAGGGYCEILWRSFYYMITIFLYFWGIIVPLEWSKIYLKEETEFFLLGFLLTISEGILRKNIIFLFFSSFLFILFYFFWSFFISFPEMPQTIGFFLGFIAGLGLFSLKGVLFGFFSGIFTFFTIQFFIGVLFFLHQILHEFIFYNFSVILISFSLGFSVGLPLVVMPQFLFYILKIFKPGFLSSAIKNWLQGM